MAQPEKQFRIGLCSASVFVNQVNGDGGKKRKIRNVQLQRRYKATGRKKLTHTNPTRKRGMRWSPHCLARASG